MNNFESLYRTLEQSLAEERVMARRYKQKGHYQATKSDGDQAMTKTIASAMNELARMQGKELVHIMPEEILDLKSAGFDVKSDPDTGAYDVTDPIADKGVHGDTEVAMVDDWGASFLKSQGGAGTVNGDTGLRQFYDVGDGSAAQGDSNNGQGDTDDSGDADSGSASATGDPDFFGNAVNGINNNPDQTNNPDADPQAAADLAEAVAAVSKDPAIAARAKDYGVDLHDLVDKNRTGSTPNMSAISADIQETVDSRHAHNPTRNQRDRNRATTSAFAAENPGVVGVTNALMGVAGIVSPAIGLVSAVGNLTNIATGKPTVGIAGLARDMGFDIGNITSSVVSEALSSVGIDLDGVDMGGIAGTAGSGDLMGGEPGDGGDGSGISTVVDQDNTKPMPGTGKDETDMSVLLQTLLDIYGQDSGATGTSLDWRW